jgi:hypothetical protein
MPGRLRTMAKRVKRILERHTQLAEELRHVGRHYPPKKGEKWDFDIPLEGDAIPPMFRRAVEETVDTNFCIDDLL